MKQLFFIVALVTLQGLNTVSAQKKGTAGDSLVWYTDAQQAMDISNKAHKPIFGFFTGSDWCGWCHKLQRDVFAKKEFIKWAQQKVVLLELDFPRNKQLPPALAEQNNGLQQAFQVGGYPTIWMFYMQKNATGPGMSLTALGSLGYPSGAEQGKEEVQFLNDANKILANKPTGK